MKPLSSDDLVLSKTINFVRFPLSVAVVILHCGYERFSGFGDVLTISDYPLFSILYYFTRLLARVAVPLFFFISGFLFFRKTEGEFSLQVYSEKIKRRVHSLLIPYIFWNSVILLGSLLMGGNDIQNYSMISILRAYWDGENGAPVNTALWFIRDLMVLSCLSPFVFFFVKRLHVYYLSLLLVLWMTDLWFHAAGLNIVSILFFSTGAYFGIFKKNFVVLFCLNKWKWYLITFVLILFLCLCTNNIEGFFANIAILLGIPSIFTTCAYFIKKNKWSPNAFLAESSFFIYCYHLSLVFLRKKVVRILLPSSSLAWIGIYLLFPAMIVLFGLIVLYFLKRYFPRTTAVITGGR